MVLKCEERGKEIIIKGRMGQRETETNEGIKCYEYTEPLIKDILDRLIEIVKPIMIDPDYLDKISDDEILGNIISKYVKWDGNRLEVVFRSAAEDSNFKLEELC